MTRDEMKSFWGWGRALAAGALAGALACLSFVVLLLFFLLLGGAVQSLSFARTGAIGGEVRSIMEVIIAGLRASLLNAGTFLWQARGGAAALAALGIVYALVERLAWRRGSTRRWSYTFAMALGLTTAVVITAQLWQRGHVAAWVVDHPGAFSIANLLLSGFGTLYAVGFGAALIVGYFTWEAWRWWYTRLFTQSRSGRPSAPLPELDDGQDWRTYTDRLRRLKHGGVAEQERTPAASGTPRGRNVRAIVLYGGGAFLMSASLWWATMTYQAIGPQVVRAAVWVEPATPHHVVPVRVDATAHHITVSNIHGEGQVRVWLSTDSEGIKVVRRGAPLPLTDDPRAITSTQVDLQELPPGRYFLHMALEDDRSSGGELRLGILYSGRPEGRLAALWAGISLGGIACFGVLLAREVMEE